MALQQMTVSHYIVALTGIGYAVVGIQQFYRNDLPGFMIWTGYAFAQIGLWMNLK
jgi:hypothetical protein